MFSKNSKLLKKTYLALSLTTALVASYQPAYVSAAPNESFGSQIVDAVDSGSQEAVLNLLRKGINPNERGEFGTSALLRAANKGDLKIAQILLDNGANPNVADLGGATALHAAARKGDFAFVDFLLNHNADVNAVDKEGNTPLMLASIKGNQRVVEDLLSHNAKVEATNNSGETALLYATEEASENIVDLLVAAGAQKDTVDEEGYSVSEVAQRKNNEVLVAKLDKADPNHVVIEMGRGFRSASSYEQNQQVAQNYQADYRTNYRSEQEAKEAKRNAARQQGEQLLASLAEKDAIDYAEANFLGDPELERVDTPRFVQLEPASGAAPKMQLASAATTKKPWLSGLKSALEDAGAFELASVQNFKEGSKYSLIELGSFKVRAFAEKRISELQQDNMDVLKDVPLVVFERGTGANLEYYVNGGIFDTRSEAESICQKLVARGVRCNPVETAMVTNDQFAKFNAPVQSAYSAPEVEAVKIPELPKADAAISPAPTLPIASAKPMPVAPTLAKITPVAPAAPAPAPLTLAKVEPKTAPTTPATPSLPQGNMLKAPTLAPALPTLTKAEPMKPVVQPVAVAKVTPVEPENDDVSLLEMAGMAEDDKKAPAAPTPAPAPKSISALVDSIYKEKAAATKPASAPAPVKLAPVVPPQKVENIAEVEKQLHALPAITPAQSPAPTPAKEPLKIVFAEPNQAPKPATIIAPANAIPTTLKNPSAPKIKIAEFQAAPATINNTSTRQPSLVNSYAQNAPTPAPSPVPKIVAEDAVAIPATPVSAPVPAKAPAAPHDKFIVSKPIRVDDAASVPTQAPVSNLPAPAGYLDAPATVTYNDVYTPPALALDRRERRRMAQVDYFATPTAAQGLYWKYRQAGVLSDSTTVRATRDLLHGVHYSALIGEFSTTAEAHAFCNMVYKAEKLRCRVQDELDYTSAPPAVGIARTYQRHSNFAPQGRNMMRHGSR